MFFYQDDGWITTDYAGEYETENIIDHGVNFYREKGILYSDLPEDHMDGDVVQLTDENFDSIVHSSNEIWILSFMA